MVARNGHLSCLANLFLLGSDNGLVCTSRNYRAFVTNYGLQKELITPHSPERNGMIDRVMHPVGDPYTHRHPFATLQDANRVIEERISFYNHRHTY